MKATPRHPTSNDPKTLVGGRGKRTDAVKTKAPAMRRAQGGLCHEAVIGFLLGSLLGSLLGCRDGCGLELLWRTLQGV